MSANLVTCPRCAGFARAFERHAHVNDGRCLLCDGALVVPGAVAAADVAAGRSAAPAPGKRVDLTGFGTCRIERNAQGFVVHVLSDVGELPAWFSVSGGRVRVVEACNGLRPVRAELRDALQGALRERVAA